MSCVLAETPSKRLTNFRKRRIDGAGGVSYKKAIYIETVKRKKRNGKILFLQNRTGNEKRMKLQRSRRY